MFVQGLLLCVMKWWTGTNAIGPTVVAGITLLECLSHEFICSPCLPEKAPAPSPRSSSGSCGVVRKKGLLLYPVPVLGL